MSARPLAAAAFVVLAGCSASPDRVELAFRAPAGLTPVPPSRSVSIAEGDVLVVEATPRGGDEVGNECVNAGSSDPAIVDVKRMQDCRSFVLMPRSGGNATVTFRFGDLRVPLAFSVQPRP